MGRAGAGRGGPGWGRKRANRERKGKRADFAQEKPYSPANLAAGLEDEHALEPEEVLELLRAAQARDAAADDDRVEGLVRGRLRIGHGGSEQMKELSALLLASLRHRKCLLLGGAEVGAKAERAEEGGVPAGVGRREGEGKEGER